MKKITLLLALLTFGLHAQDFPSPYCDIDADGTTVEEITSVDFAETSITTMDASSILVDKTDTIVDITPDETYTIAVEGDTKGDFNTDIVAFVDWNQNEVLDDEGEIYEIGTLTNSTGDDGISVSMDITVPSDAVQGTTRIRITKTYTDEEGDGGAPPSPALINPCAIEFDAFGQGASPGFGQALDFTLNIGTLGNETFETDALSVYPVPTEDVLNLDYNSILNSVKIYNLLGQEVYSKNKPASNLQLNLSGLSAGVYIVKLVAGEGQEHSFRIVKE
jgi:hypothetical protein